MTVLAVMRHGATTWTEARRLQGRTDLGLSAAGTAAVRGWRLPAEMAGFARFSSPLRRCRETAALLCPQAAGEPTFPPTFHVEPRLIEMSFGAWEGRTLADLRAELGPAMRAREARGLDFRAPGGESPREVQARLLPWLAERAASGRDSLAVTHRGVIRALYALAAGWPMTGKPPVRLVDPALHLFTLGPEGSLAVRALNLPLIPAPPSALSRRGGRGRGPVRQHGEGEGQAAARPPGPRPDPHPAPSAPPSPAARERDKRGPAAR